MKLRIHSEYQHMEEFLRALPCFFAERGVTLREGRNTIKLFEVGGVQIVVKKFKRPNTLNRFVYTFLRKDKASRAYLYAARLRGMGIETPPEIATITERKKGLFSIGYLVTAYSDYRPVAELLTEENLRQRGARGLAMLDAFAAFTASLHEKGIEHLDYNDTNVIFKEENGECRFALIDINRMKFRKKLSARRCLANLNRIECDLEVFLHVGRTYARLRDWNQTRGVFGAVGYKFLFERRKQRKKELKLRLGIPVPT